MPFSFTRDVSGLTHFKPDLHSVAFLKLLRISDAVFKGHEIAAIFGKQGSLPLRFPDPDLSRDHSPAVSHDAGDGFQAMALLRRHGHEVKRRRPSPKPDLALELDVHGSIIPDAKLYRFGAGAQRVFQLVPTFLHHLLYPKLVVLPLQCALSFMN